MIRIATLKKQVLLVYVDLIIVIGSIFISSISRIGVHNGLNYIVNNYSAFIVTSVIYLFAFYMAGLYDFRKDFRSPTHIWTIASASIVAFIIVTFCFYVNWSLRLGRGIFLINGILIPIFLVSWRYFYSHLTHKPQFQTRGVIFGAGCSGGTILEQIKKVKGYGLNIIGFLDDDKLKVGSIIDGVPVLGGTNDLPEIIEKHKISQIVVAITREKNTDLIKALIKCSQNGVNVTDMPTLYEGLTGKIPFDNIDYLWLLNNLTMQSKFHVQTIKRAMDLFLSFLILLVFLPIIPFIITLIKAGSKGSVFYVQERLGRNAKPFKMIKFRSMVQDAEKETGAVFAQGRDSRITGVGKILRKWRLDELPQFYNVFKGDMSLVGPRPEREVFIKEYEVNIPFYTQRLYAQPGITGWAQTKYLYTASSEQTEEKLKYDLFYIKNMSFILDCVILLQTIKVILFGKGQ